jgi:hypothetical protein
MRSERLDMLRAMYAAFNARDIDTVLAQMTDDVDWPNAWEGGRVVGHDAVRDYWTRQWAEIDPTVEPVEFTERLDGTVAVRVHAVVRSRDGGLLDDRHVVHVYAFRGELVARMDVEEDVQ